MAAASLSRSTSEISGSIVSDTSAPVPPESLYDMEDEQIKQLLQQTELSCNFLTKEVDIFERFIKRLDPKDIQGGPPLTDGSRTTASLHSSVAQRKKGRNRAGPGVERLMKLNISQKCDIATRELEELREEINKKAKEREKMMDNHKAMITECDYVLSEVTKNIYEFQRDIMRTNAKRGVIMSELIIKYFEDYMRLRDNLIEKLRLKNATMKVKRKKLMIQLKQKEESGEVRHEVDFDQLKIENKQLHERVDEKNNQLLQLKLSAGKSMQTLNFYKSKVSALSTESKKLEEGIQQRRDLLDKIERESATVTKEKEKAADINKQVRSQLEDYRVPEVMEYVKERANQYELSKTLHIWQRKVEIAEMTLRTHQQTWHQLTKRSLHYKTPVAQK